MDYTQTNVLSMTGGSDFATIADLANYVDLTTNQTITSGIKTFTTLPQSSAVPSTGSELVNKTYVDGAFVTLSTTQTISGLKTFSGNVRINNTRGLILGTTYPTAGGFINYTTPNVYYDVTGGGYHNFFVAGVPSVDVDSGGLVIRTGKKVQFYAGSTIDENSGGNSFDTNIPTGYTHKFKINSVDKFKIHPTFGCYVTDNLNLTTNQYLNWSGGSYLIEDTTNTQFLYNTLTSFKHSFLINSVKQLELVAGRATFSGEIAMKYPYAFFPNDAFTGGSMKGTAGGGFRFDADVGADFQFICDGTLALTIQGTGIAIPNNLTLTLGTANCTLSYNPTLTSLQYKVPVGKTHDFFVNNIAAVKVDASGVVIQSTAVGAAFPTQNLYLSQNKLNYIGASTTDIRYNCPTGGSHNFYQNTSTYLGFWNSTSLTLSPNNISLQLGTSSTAQIKHDTATSQLQYRTLGSYFHDFFINGTQHFEMNTSGVITNVGGYRAKNGVSGALDPVYIVISWDGSRSHIWINNTDLGGTAIASDYRLKENIKPARPVLEKLCSIPMIEFEYKDIGIWKKGKGINYGIIAHELQEAFPEYENLVSCEKDKLTCDGDIQPQSLTSAMNLLFMGSIQELNAKCIAQQTQMEVMQKQIEAQQKQIDGLVLALSKIVSP